MYKRTSSNLYLPYIRDLATDTQQSSETALSNDSQGVKIIVVWSVENMCGEHVLTHGELSYITSFLVLPKD